MWLVSHHGQRDRDSCYAALAGVTPVLGFAAVAATVTGANRENR
jgi:hypothetical protein